VTGYYERRLAAEQLRRCYEVAPPAAQAYLEAEIAHVAVRLRPGDTVLELGCGYGRVLSRLAGRAGTIWGIDTSRASLALAAGFCADEVNAGCVRLALMDAATLAFRDRFCDCVVCIQNGVSAFGVDRRALFREAVRVVRPGGRVLFSSYAQRFWPDRLDWFRIQAAAGLIGPIDETATRDGTIVCRDGFRAETVGRGEFRALAASVGLEPRLEEVGGSSLFCELVAA
jgi:2-polyprenyl-6-hydroxyphenyl methylase/3-demethylubiquinone-9 3-methyltransferase